MLNVHTLIYKEGSTKYIKKEVKNTYYRLFPEQLFLPLITKAGLVPVNN